MRPIFFAVLITGLVASAQRSVPAVAQVAKEEPKTESKDLPRDTTAAEVTRTKLLKAKVSVDFTDVKLGEVLKEFAHLAEEKSDGQLMWAYGTGFPFSQKVTFAANNKPLDVALDELLTKAGKGLGYVVVSKEGDKYDGWVRLTMTGERGFETPPPPAASAAEETEASEKFALAKKLIDAGKPAAAKPVLEIISRKFPTTKAGMEAKKILDMLAEKDK